KRVTTAGASEVALKRIFSKDAAVGIVDASAPIIADRPRQTRAGAAFRALSERLEQLADAERDQLPLWLPVALGLGTAAWFALPEANGWEAFLCLCAAFGLAPLALAPGTRWGRAAAIFCLAAALGTANIWWKSERVAAPRLTEERSATFEARVESVQKLAVEAAVRIVVAPEAAPDLPPRLRVNIPAEKAPALRPGDRVRLRAWLMPPAPAALPGAYDFSRAAWFQQIGGTGRALEIAVVPGTRQGGWSDWIAGIRQRLGEHIASRLDGGEGAIATALANGDQGGIPADDADAMRRSGLAHLLSVSGLHLTALVGAVMLVTLKLLALSPTLALRYRLTLVAAGAGAVAGIAYTILTGAEVPTVRSLIAALLVLGGIALGREALTMRLVAAGALAVILLWPESLVGPSFQLSFAAIAAIVTLHDSARVRALLARRDETLPLKAGRALLGLVLTGLAVEAALAPIGLYHFHKTGLYGAFANIVAIPLTTFVVMPCEALALLLDTVGLGGPFWWATGQGLHFLLVLARATAASPGAVAMLPEIPDGAYALMIGGGLWLCLWRSGWRRWGLAPIAAGALWAALTPAPDLLVTGDGRHAAVRDDGGDVAILRTRAGDYVRGMLAESSGLDGDLPDLDDAGRAACTDDACTIALHREGREWRILALRTRYRFDIEPLLRACAEADIVVAERRLPRRCAPRWLKADAGVLARTGGLSIRLGDTPRIETAAARWGDHPWAPSASARSARSPSVRRGRASR
ncbi:MAG: competence protein ComEC, partial [Sphingomonadales bacterium]|nr:competence protein ComEC [Sphingomonadales bacterium]